LDRKVEQGQFAHERVMRADVQRLLGNTEVVADAELNKLYPDKFPARVTVRTNDGRTFTEMREFPKGDPQEPLTPSEIEAKFLDNVAGRFDARTSKDIATRIRNLQDLRSVRQLGALLNS
jgi:2-methylcitrate dehydratase PrpD